MSKKKSKTQKYKKKLKRKIQKKQINQNNNTPNKKNQIVPKDKVKYNIFLNKEKDQKESKNNSNKISQKKHRPKNVFFRFLYEIKKNLHIIFSSAIIITFIIMLIGLFRINVLKVGTIIYIVGISLFLMLIAISYNKYISGKIFTIILISIMGFAIYQMQYTYDFIRNLNTNVYEYKTYYVVTFDNSRNRSIYNINNKKVGLLKDNCVNIERILNTKLDKVNYIEYDDINQLFDDFYSQKFRAILVNENQYKYLKNNINSNSRAVKILYEFKANAKK